LICSATEEERREEESRGAFSGEPLNNEREIYFERE